MYLLQARVYGVAPFGDMAFPFRDADANPRLVTVVHGGGGVGKTALLHVLASTRPGHTSILHRLPSSDPSGQTPPHAVCDWLLGDDDPQRPHPLSVASPNLRTFRDDEASILRRREQTLFDRKAKEGGFVFLALSSARWFSAQPVALYAPLKTVAQYDVRATASLDDASRSDLTRETKQALAYAGISAALSAGGGATLLGQQQPDTRPLGATMLEAVDAMVSLVGFRYEGVDIVSLEPVFSSRGGRKLFFEQLPTQARHLVAFAALPIRTLWSAYPGRDPKRSPGVIAIDEIDLHQDPAVQERLVHTLREQLPEVQWIVTTASSFVASACDASEVLALRRLPEDEQIELFLGAQARTH